LTGQIHFRLIFVLCKVTLPNRINSVSWMHTVTPTSYHECTQLVQKILCLNWQTAYIHGTEFVLPRAFMVLSWCDCGMSWYGVCCDRVHSRYGVDAIGWAAGAIPQSPSIWFCEHWTLYSRIHFADFMFFLYLSQSIQSARLFFQLSELGPPPPQPQESVLPPPLVGGGGAHLLAGEGVTLRSWCDRVKWPYGVKKIRIKCFMTSQSDFKSYWAASKGFLLILWWCHFKMNYKKLPSLQFVITD
jgi:hypothetical protein